MVASKITEHWAARAVRQLLYHRERLTWIHQRMAVNAASSDPSW